MKFFDFITSILLSINWSQTWPAITAVAALLTASVTFVLSIATLAMVNEMKMSREKSIAPELIVIPPIYRYEFRWIPLEDLTPIIRPELKEGEINKYETRLPVFGLKNIGKAPALNIEIEWEVHNKSIQNSFLNNKIIKPFNPSVLVQTNMFNLSKTDQNVKKGYSVYGVDKEKTNLAYCVSTPQTETTQPLTMPSGISGTYEIGLITKDRPNIFYDVIVINGDNILFTLKYTDLDNKEYSKEFIISSQLLYLPDSISSTFNSVEERYFSPSNIRGSIRFTVTPTKQ